MEIIHIIWYASYASSSPASGFAVTTSWNVGLRTNSRRPQTGRVPSPDMTQAVQSSNTVFTSRTETLEALEAHVPQTARRQGAR